MGGVVMTLRLNSSRRSGIRQIQRGRKKRVKFASMSSPCWSFIFRHPRHCPQRIRTPWSNRQWQVLLWDFEAAEGRHSAQTSRQVEEKQLVSPPWQRARSHITRCSTVPDFQKHYSDSPHPIRLTSSPATFSYSPRWNDGWKGVVLTRLRRSTEKRKTLSTHSHLRTSRDAWNHGKHAGIAVYMPKGTTSKETVETRSFGKKLIFMVKSPKFLGSPTYVTPAATIKVQDNENKNWVTYSFVTWSVTRGTKRARHWRDNKCIQNFNWKTWVVETNIETWVGG